MARKSVQYSETHAQYSKQADYQPPASSAHQPRKKSSPDFSGLSPDIAQLRQLSLDFGPEHAFKLIHGLHSAHVAICQKAQGEWHEKMVSHENAQFAAAAVSGAYDCYISQHGFSSRNRRIQSVRALTSCWADLDYYKVPGLADREPSEVLNAIMRALPWLPMPSLLFSSGQGAYIEWAFTRPLDAAQLDKWQQVMDALVTMLEPFGADHNAKDASRVLRIVGTVNSKSGRPVTAVETGPRIKFESLQCAVLDAFNEINARTQPADTTIVGSDNGCAQDATPRKPSNASDKQRAQSIKPYELALARLTDYKTLAQLRGKPRLTDGRHRFLYCFAISMCWYRADVQGVIDECASFAAEHFADARRYTAKRIGSVLERLEHKNMPRIWNGNRVANRYRLKNSTIIKMLAITPEEQRHMKTLINTQEKQRRREERRRAAGMVERAEYLATAEQRRDAVLELRRQGKAAATIAAELGMTRQRVYQILAAAQPDMFDGIE